MSNSGPTFNFPEKYDALPQLKINLKACIETCKILAEQIKKLELTRNIPK